MFAGQRSHGLALRVHILELGQAVSRKQLCGQAGMPSAPTNFAAGVAAAVAATLLTQPADMLRTHMQACAGPAAACAWWYKHPVVCAQIRDQHAKMKGVL